jgi:prepilin-type N-terminal cleavage/methylation domain-containing protein
MKNFIKKIIKEKRDRGFTLLETLVAIFILVLAITGPMVFAQSGLRTAFLARDQITAFFLAQDAIETIKNIRDDNAINNRDWLENIYVCDVEDTNCIISVETVYDPFVDPDTGETYSVGDAVIKNCTGVSCEVLKNDQFGRFGYNFSGTNVTNSRFTRNIYLEEIGAGNELQIVVEVIWTSNVRIRESRIVVQENIYNWIPRPEEQQ